MGAELRFDISDGKSLYYCEHITNGMHRMGSGLGLINTGENSKILLCARCWQGVKDTVFEDAPDRKGGEE